MGGISIDSFVRAADVVREWDRLQAERASRRFFALHVAGVEVTQGIQYYRASAHLTDPADRQPDNAMTLVSGKPAWVRVYVRSGFGSGDIGGVRGTLEVARRRFGGHYMTLTKLSPLSPRLVTAHHNPAYAAERSDLSSSVNFVVPGSDMCGYLQLTATITAPGEAVDTYVLYVDATLEQTLRLRGVMVAYNGPSSTSPGASTLTLPAPTVQDLQSTSAWTLAAFPVQSSAGYSSGGTITLSVPLSDAALCPGCCTQNWLQLNQQVWAQVVADGNQQDVLYYGLLPKGVPTGQIVGCESSGVSAGRAGDGESMAHELGHHCGFPHAPCGAVGTPDPTYPAYEPYDPVNTPNGSIGEYGFDMRTVRVLPPSVFKDMMAYCWPKWISLHNYGRLLNNPKLSPQRVCLNLLWWLDPSSRDPHVPEDWQPDPPSDVLRPAEPLPPEPLISLIGRMRAPDQIEITSVMRVNACRAIAGGATGLVVELRDGDGRPLSSAPVYELRSQARHQCGCGRDETNEGRFPIIVRALLPDVERGAALVIRSGSDDLWSRVARTREPQVRSLKATLEDDRFILTWQADVEGDGSEAWVQWSADGGETWHALATGLSAMRADLPASSLPPGQIAVRVVVSDGFDSATTDPLTVEVPPRGPDVSILAPPDRHVLGAREPMRLFAAVTDPSDPDAAPEDVRWLLDGEVVANELDAFIAAPAPGEHNLEISVTINGATSTSKASFLTLDMDAAPAEGV